MKVLAFLLHILIIFVSNQSFASAQDNSHEAHKQEDNFLKEIQITSAWARPGSYTHNSAIYLSIKNIGHDYELIGAVAGMGIANETELHTSFEDKGISRMKPISKILIPANTQVDFKPGGMHLMLIGLQTELKLGDKFFLTLHFNKPGKPESFIKKVQVEVRSE